MSNSSDIYTGTIQFNQSHFFVPFLYIFSTEQPFKNPDCTLGKRILTITVIYKVTELVILRHVYQLMLGSVLQQCWIVSYKLLLCFLMTIEALQFYFHHHIS